MSKKANYKFMAGAVTAAMVASAIAPAASANEVEAQSEFLYSDVSASNSHFDAIYKARELGILSGYQDGTFKPARELTRSNVVKGLGKYVVAASGKELSEYDLSDVEPFNDVTAASGDQELYTYSLIVKQAGIFEGSNNNLMPNQPIARQQMAKVLVNAFGLEDLPGDNSKVKDNHRAIAEFRPYIDILSENGVTVVEEFNPRGTTVRAQFASFLIRSLEASMEIPADVAAVNDAETVAAMDAALLAFEYPNYVNLGLDSRREVAEAFLGLYGDEEFYSEEEVVETLEDLIAQYRAIISGVNNARTITAMDRALEALEFAPYNSLNPSAQLGVAEDFLNAFNSRTDASGNRIPFTTIAAIETFLLQTGELAPVVEEVTANETYYNTAAPVFGSEGTATLSRNGGPAAAYTSGTEITEDGNYVLTVISAGGTTVVPFTVISIDSAAELNQALASGEEEVSLAGDITDANGSRILISDTVTFDGAGFSIDAPIEVAAGADDTEITNVTVETGNVSGGEASGFYITANRVVLDSVTVNGVDDTAGNGVDTPLGEKLITITNSEFNDLLRGVNLNSNDLVATGNTFTDVTYGIGGTENSAITVTGNSFINGTEGIGLGTGVTVASAGANVLDYLEDDNTFTDVETPVADYR
ncbi:S-layer homology domain-containing protein [Planococcus sp. CAU13]|uniref:S-layer homology domain-containing protein n=1 Tax=Planococcus sp. CAU13 TaxID=1541197 RepID=UPI00052FE8F7|nr:S-layer homology domain-containing protein [Planococcus sp. CAU13]